MNSISGMHKDGRRFFMTVPHGMSRKQLLQTKDRDFDDELFETKVKRLEDHFTNRGKANEKKKKQEEQFQEDLQTANAKLLLKTFHTIGSLTEPNFQRELQNNAPTNLLEEMTAEQLS
jgi:hypothetical protein